MNPIRAYECVRKLVAYSVKRLEGREEDIDADHQHFPKVEQDFPIESVTAQACIQKSIRL